MIFYLIIIFIIILFLIFRAYIRIKHNFWSIQPVIHSYDLFKLFYKSGIIKNELPEINKFCDFLNIKTFDFSDISIDNKKYIHNFICENYLNDETSKYKPSFNFFNASFNGHNTNSFFTIFNESFNILKDYNSQTMQNIDGLITARPINLTLNNFNKLPVYYIDFLCVNKLKRKKGIAPKLIQTHEYNQRYLNKKIKVSLFKREGELVGIVPLVIFKNNFYKISTKLTSFSSQTSSQIKFIFINKINFYLFIDFFINNYYLFQCVAITEPSNLLNLIEAEHLFIVVGILNGNIISSFIFRDYNVSYKSEKVFELSCSLINTEYNENIIYYFSNSISLINKKLLAKYVCIESLSHNCILLDKLNSLNLYPISSSQCAYFLYNYSHTPILPEKSFFLI